ncbi:pyruvate/2-oxoglutarate dehydrogenase complex dihydrolipoamide acyltransferase (E2) component [Azospirillum rugosum]|uniref:Pyruvate/2-oxoglutarate dehydrogenase complex dihydrolipoamide acyltransferase (E2) component n=1 Tax=Azospirillum rugosum TaxID=416170 RepID=A0ABS4SDS3_9PROT|nr:pyruvate/2-oxoglutarate dehydrogenase complex dihydrolipoamide acyltransferase (E2) component [Azospirillum rugosum]MDQ0525613.1 pyruvate/2-oxoglutarate dehydrogenase complex dihydrolipoamide acyltransferase (E2) component [Azospirillum rugosum]
MTVAFAPEGEGDAPAAVPPAGDQPAAPTPPAGDPPPPAPVAAPPAAPAGLEAFWDAEKAALNVDGLAKLVADDQARRAGVPEAPDGYKMELPADFALPDGLTFEPQDTPLGQSVRAIAHEFGLPQAAMSKLLAAYVDSQAQEHRQVIADIAAEQAKLGPNRDARFSAMDGWIKANLPDHHAVLAQRLPVDAGLFQAVEALIARANAGIPSATGGGGEAMSEEAYFKSLFKN